MCVRREDSAGMIQRNMDKTDDSTMDERREKDGDLPNAGSVDHEFGVALQRPADGTVDSSGRLYDTNEVKNNEGFIAPHKQLNTIRTKIEEDEEEDGKHLLSDEEIAWKLHQELNAGSPVLRTRSQRGGSKARSNLAESSLRSTGSKGKRHFDSEEDNADKAGTKRRRGSHLGNNANQDRRKSPRAKNEQASDPAEGGSILEGPIKARSRKGKPQIAAEGPEGERLNNISTKAKKPAGGRRKATKVLPQIPKLPMVRQGDHWYRARVLKEDEHRILVEFAGYEHSLPSTWLPKYCARVWLGSYKGKDWRYHGEGAWVPKNGIQNRLINAKDYGISNECVEDAVEGGERCMEKTSIAGRKTPIVGTPNLIPDVATVSPNDSLHKRRKKSNLSDLVNTERLNRRGRKRATSDDNDSKTRQNSSKSVDDSTKEESETGRRDRPRRHTKPTAILNSDDFAVDAEVDMMDSDLQNGYMDTADAYMPHAKTKGAWNSDGKRRMNYNDSNYFLNSQDEQEALEALTEMPSSPVSLQGMIHAEAMLENSREALLEAYANGKSFSYDERKIAKRRAYKSDPNLYRSHTAESISVAGQMFGGLLHAISSRLGNGIHRSMSMPVTHSSGVRNITWSPHIWSSGVTPADSEPAIIQVPKSLIQKALLSPKHVDANSRTPPVPLFY